MWVSTGLSFRIRLPCLYISVAQIFERGKGEIIVSMDGTNSAGSNHISLVLIAYQSTH